MLAKFEDGEKIIKEADRFTNTNPSFVFSIDEKLFERNIDDEQRFVSMYYLEYDDLDIVTDDGTYVLCEETGTCGYPQEGDNVYLSIYDTSQGQEFVPYFFSPIATQQTVIFSPLINL